jgi:hypothetical protein
MRNGSPMEGATMLATAPGAWCHAVVESPGRE